MPGVTVQPVIIRYENTYDTVTWTWEGIPAWKVIVYSLSQFNVNCSIEFLDPYTPSQEEKEDAKLFANNVRQGILIVYTYGFLNVFRMIKKKKNIK